EYLIVAPTCQLNEDTAYDAEKDIAFLDGPIQTIVKLYPGQACVVFPEDAHKPARHLGQASTYKKLVIKLPVA
ncbi:MAG: YhcH/YjgK/YiaL family protein, partial [Abiotrophia defectiva]